MSARDYYLRASRYYDVASFFGDGVGSDAFDELWGKHRDAWDAAAELFDPPVERVAVPFEETNLEGYVFKRDTSEAPRPTIILNNGSDGSVVDMLGQGAVAATARGWNAITFDGPGQGAALHRQNLYFRPDWETVITPVVDYLVGRPDVADAKIVLHGVSQAGYWVPRAAAFEHRLAAAVADPGVVDVGSSWLTHMPPEVAKLLDDVANKDNFDQMMQYGMDQDPHARFIMTFRGRPYGKDSEFDTFRAALAQRLDDATIARIECPVLVTSPEDEQFWPGQSQTLYDKLTCPKTLVEFKASEGANWHCEPAALGLRDQRIFDWLDEAIGA